MRFIPHSYQQRAIDFIKSHEAAGLFLEMGLGKTVIALTAVKEMLLLEVAKILVIAPLRVAEDTWSRESDKWDHLKDLRISKVLGSAADRKEALRREADIYVINRENVAWLVEYLGKSWDFDMLVIDELSSFKNNQAMRFKALRKVRPKVARVVGLTGTPAANGLMDLWAEMYLLDRGERLCRTLTEYRGRWFKPGYGCGPVVYKWEPRKGALEEITKRIGDITVSMKAEDYLTLPDKIETTVSVHLDEKALKAYQTMEKESLLELEGEEIAALDAAAVMSKLLQLANGFIYGEDHTAILLHEAKLDALEEIVEAADSPVLVFYNFQADKDQILKRFRKARLLKSDQDICDWNAGKVEMLLAHPASAGFGLNLQDGGHIMAWYGLPWSLEQYQQAVARLQRQGQKYPVMVYHLIAEGTVDQQVARSLANKDTTQSALIEVLKERKDG